MACVPYLALRWRSRRGLLELELLLLPFVRKRLESLSLADKALYASKGAGRNRVTVDAAGANGNAASAVTPAVVHTAHISPTVTRH